MVATSSMSYVRAATAFARSFVQRRLTANGRERSRSSVQTSSCTTGYNPLSTTWMQSFIWPRRPPAPERLTSCRFDGRGHRTPPRCHDAVIGKRLVHVSSLVVYDWAKAHDTLDEDTPLLSEGDLPYMGAYTVAKTWQEKLVSRYAKDHAWDLTITRPGFIWGAAACRDRRHGQTQGAALCDVRPVQPPSPDPRRELRELPRRSAGEHRYGRHTFNVIDGDHVRVWRYVREYARGTGQPGLPVPVPYRLALGVAELASLVNRTLMGGNRRLPSLLTPRRLESQFKPLRFSNQKLHDVLGWTPPLTFEECVKLTYGSAT